MRKKAGHLNNSQTIPPPQEFAKHYPLHQREAKLIGRYRQIARRIVSGLDHRIPLIIGPCSIHSIDAALEYAYRLKKLCEEVADTLFPVMRVYVEKPRTVLGWKGFIYDPYLNGTNDLASGIAMTRTLFLEITRLGMPIACEFLHPLITPYYKDLVTWGFIGARTTSSQPHRELASSLNFPIGIKNDINGNYQAAIDTIVATRSSHMLFSIDHNGHPSSTHTSGNMFTHLVLRGGEKCTNYDSASIRAAYALQKSSGIVTPILIDCAHSNSQKNPKKQKEVFFEAATQLANHPASLLGLMMESYLNEGQQSFDYGASFDPSISITDPCIGWEDTETMVRWLHQSLLTKHRDNMLCSNL